MTFRGLYEIIVLKSKENPARDKQGKHRRDTHEGGGIRIALYGESVTTIITAYAPYSKVFKYANK